MRSADKGHLGLVVANGIVGVATVIVVGVVGFNQPVEQGKSEKK